MLDSLVGVERWQPTAWPVDPWTVLRLSRYRRRDEVSPAIWDAARGMAARAEALAEPRALLALAEVARADADGARLGDGSRFSGRAIGRLLAPCPQAVVFVLTLGPRLEAEAAALADRQELLEAYLLDRAGWAVIEAAVRALRADLVTALRPRGWRATGRLGPGHLDWPLEEQRGLLGLFGETQDLVRLSEHGVLVPFKSVSGAFGLAPGDRG